MLTRKVECEVFVRKYSAAAVLDKGSEDRIDATVRFEVPMSDDLRQALAIQPGSVPLSDEGCPIFSRAALSDSLGALTMPVQPGRNPDKVTLKPKQPYLRRVEDFITGVGLVFEAVHENCPSQYREFWQKQMLNGGIHTTLEPQQEDLPEFDNGDPDSDTKKAKGAAKKAKGAKEGGR